MGSNPVQVWIFFRRYFHYCLGSVHYHEDRFRGYFLIWSSNIRLSYIYSQNRTTVTLGSLDLYYPQLKLFQILI